MSRELRTVLVGAIVLCIIMIGSSNLAHAQEPTESVVATSNSLYRVQVWTWYDKLPDSTPNPWTYSGPMLTSYNGDSAWEESFGTPQTDFTSVDGNQSYKGDAPKEIWLPAGKYKVEILPPAEPSPNGTSWKLTTETLQFVDVGPDGIHVLQPESGKWTEFLLIGLINSDPGGTCTATLAYEGTVLSGRCLSGSTKYWLTIRTSLFDESRVIATDPYGNFTLYKFGGVIPSEVYLRDQGFNRVTNSVFLPGIN